MKLFFSCLLWLPILLAGCASYGDIHSHSLETNASSLATQHVYTIPHSTAAAGTDWWGRFKDPQLDQLIRVALQDSPSLQVTESRLRKAQHAAEEASAALWPSVDLSGYVQRQRYSESGLVPPPFNGHTYNLGDIGLNFNYEFDFWGKNRQTLMAKINTARAEEAEVAESRLVLSTAVANVWFQLCNDVAQAHIAKADWQLSKNRLDIAIDRMKQGIRSAIPVKTLQTTMETAKQTYEQYRYAESFSRYQLAVLLGKNPFNTRIETRQTVFHLWSVSLSPHLPANLLGQRPDITAARLRVLAAANRVQVAKARFFPDINLNALIGFQSIHLNQLFSAQNRDLAITGAIDLPIFDAGARRANLGIQYAEYDIAVNQYNHAILNALLETSERLSALKMIKAQLAAQNTALNAIRQNNQLYTLRYQHGIADYVQILESKKQLLHQQARQLDLQTRYLKTWVATLKALGGHDG